MGAVCKLAGGPTVWTPPPLLLLQVPGAGVQGWCQGGSAHAGAEYVRFGSLDFVRGSLPAGAAQDQLDRWAHFFSFLTLS